MLARPAIARVLQSLLTAELATSRGGCGGDLPPHLHRAWPDAIDIGDATRSSNSLGCDSLERLQLASAVNEMFHLHEMNEEGGLLRDTTFGSWIDRIEAGWRGGVHRLTFTTSGSTGRPKRCTHAVEYLHAEIRFLSKLWQGRGRIIALVPAHHIYGFLFTAVLPDALGIPCLDAMHLGPGELARSLEPGDLVVTFPERWRWLERSLPGWPADVEGVVSTAPCPAELIEGLRGAGLAKLTEVYGSTETAGIATREGPTEAYRLMPQWRFASPFDEAQPTLVHQSGHRAMLMDMVHRMGDDGFRLAGRRDGMVQVGGINVMPEHVAAQLRTRPGVANVTVRLMRPEEGSRLKAFIVPMPGRDPERVRRDLEAWMALHLSASERPRSLTLGSDLPKGIMGKPLDW